MNLLADLRKRAQTRREQMLLALVKEAIKIPAVQRAIADEFAGGTPMCRVLDDAVNNKMDRIEVKADDVDGFEAEVEECLGRYFSGENFTIDSEQINDLDDALDKYLDDKMDDLVSNVVDEIARRINK